jgi:DNA-binding MarR family transcriptional regulator
MSQSHAVTDYPQLQLENQLCFPLYAASRLLTRLYQEELTPLGLTYPQYIVMMILWSDSPCSVKQLGERAMLNTNTLTPLLKRLESLGYVQRSRGIEDERVRLFAVTKSGWALREACVTIPMTLLAKLAAHDVALGQLKLDLDRILLGLCAASSGV